MRRESILVVLCVMLAVLLVGCGKEEEVVSELPTSEVESGVISEEVSEPVPEESSEEIVSEEPPEETMDLTLYIEANGKTVVDLMNDMNSNEFRVVVWRYGEGAKAILSEGDSYRMQEEDDRLCLYYPNQMEIVEANMDYVEVTNENEKTCIFNVYRTGDNIEVNFTGTDVKGKEYEITFYVTKDWKYEWE